MYFLIPSGQKIRRMVILPKVTEYLELIHKRHRDFYIRDGDFSDQGWGVFFPWFSLLNQPGVWTNDTI